MAQRNPTPSKTRMVELYVGEGSTMGRWWTFTTLVDPTLSDAEAEKAAIVELTRGLEAPDYNGDPVAFFGLLWLAPLD